MNDSYLNSLKDGHSQFLNYLQLLWFRRRLILIITLIIGIFGVIWLSEQAPVYRSTSSLMIGFPSTEAMAANAGDTTEHPAAINNEIEILRSRELITNIITRFQLQVYDEFHPSQIVGSKGIFGFVESLKMTVIDWVTPAPQSHDDTTGQAMDQNKEDLQQVSLSVATDIFLDKLSVEQAGESNLVNISFESLDPQLAARIANTLPEAYIAAQLQAKLDASETVSTWFSEQFKVLKERLDSSERAVDYYRKTLGLEYTETARTELLDQQLSDLNNRIIISRTQKANATARLSLVKSIAEDTGNFEQAVENLVDNPAIQQLLSQKAELMKAIVGLAADNPSDQSKLTAINAEIAEINITIRSEFNNIMIALQNEMTKISEAADRLEAELTKATLESGTQHLRLLHLKALEEETVINRIKFEAFVDRFKDSGLSVDAITPDSKLVSLAEVSLVPLYPDRTRKLVTIVLAGLAIAVISIFLSQLRNPGMLSPEHVEHVLGSRTIGVIPIVPGKKVAHDYVVEDPKSDYVSAINALKITLDLANLDNKVKVIQLVSSIPEEGNTSLAISLAQAVASFGQKVLLVNANLRSSAIQEKLNLSLEAKGLTDLMLSNEDELAEYVMTDVKGGIQFLPAGTAVYANADVVFSSQRMTTIVNKMRAQYDFIIFDAPPVQTSSDAISISKHVDKTLFVIRWNKTPMKVAKAALRKLQAGNVDLAGIVLERVNLQLYENIAYSDYGYIYNQRH